MTSPIEQLPVELIEIIFEHLCLPQHQALRLVSRQLHALTLSPFSKTHYSRQRTTLGFPSLDRLLRVSSCRYFANSVSLLDVKLFSHEEYQNLQEISRIGIYPPPKRFAQVTQIRAENISQEAALFDYMRIDDDPKLVTDKLSRVLRRFPNIKGIRLRVNGVKLHDRRCPPYSEEPVYLDFLSACFRAVLTALVKSKVRIEDFSLMKGPRIRPLTKSANVVYPAFYFSISHLLSLRHAFSSLRSLSLSIGTKHNGNARAPGWQDTVSQFIATGSALEELNLCFQPGDRGPQYRASVMNSVARSIELPKLKHFQLYGCAVDEQDLITFTKTHCSSLRRIIIRDAYLRQGMWLSVLTSFRGTLDLTYCRLSYLQQSSVPNDIWWRAGDRTKEKTWIVMDTEDPQNSRRMEEMLSEAIHLLARTMDGSDPQARSHLPYSILLDHERDGED